MAVAGGQRNTKSRRRGLKKKILLSIFLVGLLPLFIGQIMAFIQGRQEILEVNGANFQALATEAARNIDLILMEEESKTRRIATEPILIADMEARRDALVELDHNSYEAIIQKEQQAWQDKDPAFIESLTQGTIPELLRHHYLGTFANSGRPVPPVTRSATRALFVTDIKGRIVASLDSDAPFRNEQSKAWQGAYHNGVGKPYFGNVTYDNKLTSYTFTLAIPIMDSIRYQAVGVLHRVYDAKEFFAPSLDTIQFGNNGHVMLVDSHGTVMSCPILPTGTPIPFQQFIPSMSVQHPGWTQTSGDAHGSTSTAIIGFAPLPAVNRVTSSSSGTSWHTFVWTASDELLAPIRHLSMWIGVFGLIALGLLVTLGSIMAGRMVNPIRRLQEAAHHIGKGISTEPLSIRTNDELEDLADEVNRMNQELQAAFGGLRSEVEMTTQAMHELQESTNHILNHVPTPVIILDSNQQVTYLNEAGRNALQCAQAQCEGSSLFDLLRVDTSVQDKLQHEFSNVGQESSDTPTMSPTNGHSRTVMLKDPLSPSASLLPASRERTVEIAGRIFWYDWFFIGATHQDTNEIGLVLRDATEESLVQEKVAHKEKVDSLGILCAGIGHELNNPLVGVIGMGEAIQEEDDPAQIKTYAQQIIQHGKRMATVVRNFTGDLRSQSYGLTTPVDIQEELVKAWDLVKEHHDTALITLHTDFPCTASIPAQAEEIRQAFVHVITNAVQAMEGKGSLCLATSCSNEDITVFVRDTGPGIPSAHLSKLFDPFFTTKRQGEGSGLGLTITQRIVNRYNGTIHIHSSEQDGTICEISFPRE